METTIPEVDSPQGPSPSPYNLYMKAKLAELKEKYPDMSHKDRFKKVAEDWKTSSANLAYQTKETEEKNSD